MRQINVNKNYPTNNSDYFCHPYNFAFYREPKTLPNEQNERNKCKEKINQDGGFFDANVSLAD